MSWEVREAARLSEMHYGKRSLRVSLAQDGDIIVSIDYDGCPVGDSLTGDGPAAVVEFCSTAGDGGRSPNTRKALAALYEAMLQDAREYPEGVPQFPVHVRKQMLGKTE